MKKIIVKIFLTLAVVGVSMYFGGRIALYRLKVAYGDTDLVVYHWNKLHETKILFLILQPLRAGEIDEALRRVGFYLDIKLLDAARHRNLAALSQYEPADDVLSVNWKALKEDREKHPRHTGNPNSWKENEINELLDKLIEEQKWLARKRMERMQQEKEEGRSGSGAL